MTRSFRSPSGKFEILSRRASDKARSSQRFLDRGEAERFLRNMLAGDVSGAGLRRFALSQGVDAGRDMIGDLADELARGEIRIVRARSRISDPPGDVVEPEKPKGGDKPKKDRPTPKTDDPEDEVRTINIRIVHDGGDPVTTSPTVVAEIGVSQRRTNLDLPTNFTTASDDPRNYHVDVFDDKAGGNSLNANIQVLKPNNSAFSPDRRMQVQCQRVGSTDWFRSRYLRLVVDDIDEAAVAGQTVLVDWDPSSVATEILGQKVKATYSAAGQSAEALATVGINKGRIKMAVHVMRANVGQDASAVVTTAQAKQRVDQWFRRVYAQVDLAPRLTEPVQLIDPQSNLLSISDNTGANAAGGGSISFRARIRGGGSGGADLLYDFGPYSPPANQTPMDTAVALAGLVNDPLASPVGWNIGDDLVPNPLGARVTQNPPTLETPITQGSADLMVGHMLDRRVELERVVSSDASQTATVGQVTAANFRGWAIGGLLNWVAGSIEQRTLLQNYGNGHTVFDLFVVNSFSTGERGQAMFRGSFYPAGKQGIDKITNAAFSIATCMDGSASNPFSAPHELGHALVDAVHATGDRNQLLASGTSAANVVTGTKRYKDTTQSFDSPAISFVQPTRIRANGSDFLDGW